MKKILTLLIMTAALLPMKAQVTDTAAWVVDRYLKILNHDALPKDSMVYIHTVIIDRDDPADSMVMNRWDAYPHKYRSEIYNRGALEFGVISDGEKFFMYYDEQRGAWRTTNLATALECQQAYDLRGPLYNWKARGAELEYAGEVESRGAKLYQVNVACPGVFDRQYFFEKESGLMCKYHELPHTMADTVNMKYRVDMHLYHEFAPIGKSVLPAVESYLYDGHIYIVRHTAVMKPVEEKYFTKEKIEK